MAYLSLKNLDAKIDILHTKM